jgi:hypothetical protein
VHGVISLWAKNAEPVGEILQAKVRIKSDDIILLPRAIVILFLFFLGEC